MGNILSDLNGSAFMESHLRRFRRARRLLSREWSAVLVWASVAQGDEDSDRKAMFQMVTPAIIHVTHGEVQGGGFVVDVGKGIVATNYHVIEGAKKITIFFPFDKDEMKKGLPADGYFAILPGKDLALIHVNFGGRKVAALKLAKKTPEQGDTAYTFGSLIGFQPSVAEGMVTAVRTGQEVSRLMERFSPGMYVKALGYDLDAVWIQNSAPMMHGNSGGPLINRSGEVVGLNTMAVASEGNFAISAKHVRDLVAKAGKEVKVWSTLPPPREHPR